MKFFRGVCLLLALGSSTARGDGGSTCSPGGVTELRDTLRQSACRLRGNRTEGDIFRAHVQAKHGVGASSYYVRSASPFRLTATKMWCYASCEDLSPENVTWCVNIGYLDRDVETCITTDATQEVVTNSSCEAEAVGLPSYLSLPSDCDYVSEVGCLGLTNLDWFFESAYLTCTAHTDTCYQKMFTRLFTRVAVSQPPDFEQFSSSPHVVPVGSRMVLEAVVRSTAGHIISSWQHNGSILYEHFIFEDPFCDRTVEECHNDSSPAAAVLRQQRVRVYQFGRIVDQDECPSTIYTYQYNIQYNIRLGYLYRVQSYLVVDNAREEDSGEYTFGIAAGYTLPSLVGANRTVNASISCQPPPDSAMCNIGSLSVGKGSTIEWFCEITARPSTNFSLVFKKFILLPSMPGDVECGREPQVIFSVEEFPQLGCLSRYRVSVVICSANESVVGEFRILNSSGSVVIGTTVVIELIPEPTAVCVTLSDNATCSTGSLSVDKGNTIDWNCQITSRPSTNFSLVLNRKTILLPSTPGDGDVECGREPQVIFSVEEYPQHVCLSRYRVSVVICSANESVVGEFHILNSSGSVVIGTTVVVELITEPTAVCSTPADNATCSSTGSLSVDEGNTIDWNCQITARPSTNFSLVFKKFILLPSTPGDGDVECGREPQVIFSVEEYPQHVCLSSYRVSVVICSANESVVGEFRIVKRSGSVVVGTTVVVELIKDSRLGPDDVHDGCQANTTDKHRDQSSDECPDECSELTVAVVITAVLGPLLGALIGVLLTILAHKFCCKNAPATHLSSKPTGYSEMASASSPVTKETFIMSDKAASSETQN